MAKTKQSRGKLVRKFGENIFGNPKFEIPKRDSTF